MVITRADVALEELTKKAKTYEVADRYGTYRPVFRIRISLNADPDPGFYLNADPDSGFWIPDPDPRSFLPKN